LRAATYDPQDGADKAQRLVFIADLDAATTTEKAHNLAPLPFVQCNC
jgi:hypothetical protein